jgi:hypothetical protein
MEKNGLLPEGMVLHTCHGSGAFDWNFYDSFKLDAATEFTQRLTCLNAVIQLYCDWVDHYSFGHIVFCVLDDDQ